MDASHPRAYRSATAARRRWHIRTPVDHTRKTADSSPPPASSVRRPRLFLCARSQLRPFMASRASARSRRRTHFSTHALRTVARRSWSLCGAPNHIARRTARISFPVNRSSTFAAPSHAQLCGGRRTGSASGNRPSDRCSRNRTHSWCPQG
ncbi:hypothetical protein PsYK624_166020 [Phanerochaete sordida]|uniref:Uncharacterized protein n=1 Tax=Phanerochaete sordida TaxID=48140 RepID=A0A9P3LM89_9APHY|nr:hypothetical protein PsYK624_166020 [Phanerochaete sordida]